jgi:hypothetical protein
MVSRKVPDLMFQTYIRSDAITRLQPRALKKASADHVRVSTLFSSWIDACIAWVPVRGLREYGAAQRKKGRQHGIRIIRSPQHEHFDRIGLLQLHFPENDVREADQSERIRHKCRTQAGRHQRQNRMILVKMMHHVGSHARLVEHGAQHSVAVAGPVHRIHDEVAGIQVMQRQLRLAGPWIAVVKGEDKALLADAGRLALICRFLNSLARGRERGSETAMSSTPGAG